MSKISGNTARKKATHYRDYLNDILRYAEMGERITIDIDFETFCSNDEKTLAAIQILGDIGEASKKLPKSLKNRYPEVPGARWLRHGTSSFMHKTIMLRSI